jgi:hypothetical protein
MMRLDLKRLTFALTAALLIPVAGCGGSTPKKDAAVPKDGPRDTTGGGGETAPGMCVGTFATYTRTSLGNAVAAGVGKCTTAADLDVICAVDVGQTTRDCGPTCLATGKTGDMLAACVIDCVKTRLATRPSEACLGCYAAATACTIDKCLAVCLDPNSTACLTCQTQNGCLSGFFVCSGLPAPGQAPPDGGRPEGGAMEGGAGDRPDAGAPDRAPDGGAPDTAVDMAAPAEAGPPDTAPDTAPPVDAAVDTAAPAPDAEPDAAPDTTPDTTTD